MPLVVRMGKNLSRNPCVGASSDWCVCHRRKAHKSYPGNQGPYERLTYARRVSNYNLGVPSPPLGDVPRLRRPVPTGNVLPLQRYQG